MATLLGQKINATYDSLLKTEDNDGITGSLKQITDGVGQTTPLYLSTTEAKIGGNLEIAGDLTVGGTTTYVNTDNVTVKDGLVLLANNNVADILDIGLYGKYNDGTVKYTGLYRDATDGVFKIFDGLATEPTTTVGGGDLADFAAAGGSFSGNLTVSGNYYSTDGAISLTNGDIVTGGHIAINSGNAATSFSSNANNLIVGGVDSVAHQGLTIGSYSGATGNIFFADGITGDEQYRGLITYNHTNDKMYLGAGASNQVSIDEFGNVDILKSGVQLNFADNGQISCWDDNHRIRFRRSENILEFVEYGDILMSSGGSEKMRIDSAGNVGIGDTPDTLLHIKGSAPSFKIESTDTSASLNIPAGSINFFGGYSDSIEIASIRSIDASSGGVAGQLAFYTSEDPDTPTERMRIDNLGRVGIGTGATITSGFILETAGNIKSGGRLSLGRSGTNYDSIGYNVGFTGTSSNWNYIASDAASLLSFEAGGFVFRGAGSGTAGNAITMTERMRIDSSGNVGIGEQNPASDLHISSSFPEIRLQDNAYPATNHYSTIDGNGGSGILTLSADNSNAASNSAMVFKVDASERMRIDSSGNVTINSGTIKDASGNSRVYWGTDSYINSPTGDIRFFAGSERMRIDSSGDILINQATDYGNKVVINQTSNYTGLNGTAGLRIYSSASTAGVGQYHGAIEFAKGTGAAAIAALQDGSDSDKVGLSFWVHGSSTGADASVQAMNIDSSGNVGIGGSATNSSLGISRASGAARLALQRTNANTTGAVGQIGFQNLNGEYVSGIVAYGDGNDAGSHLAFHTTSDAVPTDDNVFELEERMRITSGGNVLIGNDSSSAIAGGGEEGTIIGVNGSIFTGKDSTSARTHYNFYNPNGKVGSITTSGSATAYNTSSDYRLKEDWQPMSGALDRVDALKPVNFAWKANGERVDGFLAHELQEVIPEAVTGEKDAMRDEEYEVSPAVYEDVVHPAEEAVYETIEHPAIAEELDADGNIIVEAQEAWTEEVLVSEAKEEWTEKVLVSEAVMGTRSVPDYQGIDQSKIVPLLVAAIQELKAEVDALKGA